MSNDLQHHEKTAIGLEVAYTAPLVYLLGWISGLVFLLVEKDNAYVRFHAAQSVAWFGSLALVTTVLNFIPILGQIAAALLGLVGLFSWIVLMYKAWNDSRTGEPLRLPFFSDLADKIVDAI